ncbi:unnamed protein product, partial [Closterium sp. NIES-54]
NFDRTLISGPIPSFIGALKNLNTLLFSVVPKPAFGSFSALLTRLTVWVKNISRFLTGAFSQ